MTDILREVLTFWSIPAVVSAVVSGIAMAYVIERIRPSDWRLASFFAIVLGALWYVPQVTQRFLDPGAPADAEWRTIGTAALYFLGFAFPMAVALAWHERQRRG